VSPQQRSLVTLLGLTAVAAAVGLYAYFGVMKVDEQEQEEKAVADKLFSTSGPTPEKTSDGGAPPQPEFTKIAVRAKGETTVVEKQPDGTWRMTAPVKAAVDQYVLDSLTSQLKDGKVDQKVEEKPGDEDLKRYGLKEPQWTVEASALVPDPKDPSAPKQPRQVKLEGGVENTFNGSIYLRKDADPAVYAASGGIRFNLEKTAYDLRDKQVLAVDEPKIQTLDVVRPKGGGYSLLRGEGEGTRAWKMTGPKAQDADGQAVINVLGQLKSERATAFLADSPEERKKHGLESPAVDATFVMKDGEKIRLRLAKAADKHYALREDREGAVLAEVGSAALGHLDKPADDLRDKSVLQFKRDEVAELLFKPEGGGPAIEVKRDLPPAGAGDAGAAPSAESWAVAAPEKGPAKAWKVSSNLWTLSSLQATAFGEENPKSWDKYGISDRSRQVVLRGAGGKVLTALSVGSEVKGKANTVYVRGSRNQVMEMDSARLSDFPQRVDDIIDRPPPPPPPATLDGGAPF